MAKRKFPRGLTKLYRSILETVFEGAATDEQLSATVTLMWTIADDEFAPGYRRITEDDALEWIARAIQISRMAPRVAACADCEAVIPQGQGLGFSVQEWPDKSKPRGIELTPLCLVCMAKRISPV